MTTCATCGSHLSRDYLRVCGDNTDTVRDCPHCEATRRAEKRRSASDGGDSSDAGDGGDSEKLVLTAETGTDGRDADESARRSGRRGHDRRGGPRRPGVAAAAGDDRQDGKKGAGSRGPGRGSHDGDAGSQPSILSSVFDALR